MNTVIISYKRNGSAGTLTLRGIVDIFEANRLHETAVCALNDTKATTIKVSLASVERLDLTAIQILSSLRQDLNKQGRTYASEALPAPLAASLSAAGIVL